MKYKTYTENYEMLVEEMKENLSKWKTIHVHGLEYLVLLRCQYSPDLSTN